jgi:internalin A
MRFFPQVEWLSFTDNNVTSLEFVKYLPKLEELHAQLNPIKSIDPLKGKNLKVLKVGSRESEFNISVLSDMKNLEILRIGGDYDDLSTLANLTKLRELSVRVNPNNLCVINNLVNLRELYIYNSNLTDISCLNNLKGITRLNLDNNRLTSVEDIANNFPNLETLSIEGNPITDLSPLTKLTKLRFLYVDKEKLRDCSPKNDTEIKAGKSCNNSWIRRLYDSLF